MASSFTTNFGFEEINTGEQSGTWGNTTNFNYDILDRIASYAAVGLSGSSHTLIVREASPGEATENLQDGMYRVINFTGALGANNVVTITPNTTKAYFIFINSTTDSASSGPYNVDISQGSGANITIPNGKSAVVYCNGAGGGAAVIDALANLYISDSIQIGSGVAEDYKLVFDGNAQDYYIGLDDSADDLVIGLGSAVGTTPAISIDENQAVTLPAASVTIGDGTAEDTKLVYNGNAQDYYIGLDDSADDLVIGLGSAVGTTPAVTIDENQAVVFPAAKATIGDGTAEDTLLVYDGNAKDFYMGLDDSADKLVVGVGSAAGTNSILTLDDDSVTVGDGAAADTKIVFDGNAQDYYVGLDDSADDLVIGLGSAVGTTPAISINSTQITTFGKAAIGATLTATGQGGSTTLDFNTYQNFILTLTSDITLANPTTETVGQSGIIVFIQDGGSDTLSLGTDYETAGGAGITLSTADTSVDIIPYFIQSAGNIQLGAVQLAFS